MVVCHALIDLKTCGDHCRNYENDSHRLGELLEELNDKRFLLALDKLVFSVFLESCGGFGRVKTVGGGVHLGENLGCLF